nr:hypothetical protein CFP56_19411 [Quercus suber]
MGAAWLQITSFFRGRATPSSCELPSIFHRHARLPDLRSHLPASPAGHSALVLMLGEMLCIAHDASTRLLADMDSALLPGVPQTRYRRSSGRYNVRTFSLPPS